MNYDLGLVCGYKYLLDRSAEVHYLMLRKKLFELFRGLRNRELQYSIQGEDSRERNRPSESQIHVPEFLILGILSSNCFFPGVEINTIRKKYCVIINI